MVSHGIAQTTANQWDDFLAEGSDRQHLDQLIAILDEEEPDFRQ